MIRVSLKRISTIIMVLILFSGEVISLPLSRTCYTAPADNIDFYFGEKLISDKNLHRVDVLALNLGLTDATTIGVEWNYLNYDLSGDESKTGDTLLEFWHYTGRYLYDRVDSGISIKIRMPTGPDPVKDEKWRNLSVGRNEVKITPVLSLKLSGKELLNLNVSYTLREGRDDDFYGSLKGDLKKADTYKSIFGLNPFSEDSFFSGHRLSDDYMSTAVSFVETRLHPVVLFGEIYHAFTDFQRDSEVPLKTAEGEGGSVTFISAGCKYMVGNSFFPIIYFKVNPFYSGEGERWSSGIGINIFF
ncbi:MAG TPA: hypothetical protein PLY21_13940 [Spirochaetota bacterium]|nr:hypothetical protein [Spirochaetota bacterium]